MSLIEWKDGFSVGVEAVDHEHRELIALINELYQMTQSGGGRDQVVASLGEIYAQIAAHFALEEKMMRDAAYPAYPDHKSDHESLLDQLRDIMDRVEDDGSYDDARLSRDLERWFTDHFRTHDAKLHFPSR
jgi:hemerythrin-like metal-binding protein